jgi:CRP-like cAMP-binding protein
MVVRVADLKELELFCRQFKQRFYKKGQILLDEGDDSEDIFCLLKGNIREFYLLESGNELTVYILSPISYFPISLILGVKLNAFCYEAMTNCFVTKISRAKLIDFVKDKPVLMNKLMKKLISEYAENLDRLGELVFGNAHQKVISVLLYLAKHFGEKSRKIIVVPIKFTHQDIAALAGVTRETASIVMGDLKHKKVVYYYNGIVTISSLNKLEKELSQETINTKVAPGNILA